jgi:nucleoside-diphosphate-sugar epimerase
LSGPLIALTGATGFIGRHLLAGLTRRGYRVRVLLRRPTEPLPAASAVIGDLAAPRHLGEALAGVDAVVHSAGLAHAMSGRPEDDYRAINTEGTVALARAATRAGARRFVFLSSVRAQTGPSSEGVVTEADVPHPTDAYGRSKLAAEQGLADTAIDWVALRPTLVYGSGVKGNMETLLRLAGLPLPLPLAALRNRRSLLAVENLVEAVDWALHHPGPLRKALIVSDREALTPGEMVAALRRGLGRRPGLVPVPPALLAAALRLGGHPDLFERLSGALVAPPAGLAALGWRPVVDSRSALAALAAAPRGEVLPVRAS